MLLLSLTGAAMVFPAQARAVLGALLPDAGAEAAAAAADPPALRDAGSIDWPSVLAAAAARFPGAELRIVSWPVGEGTVSVRLREPAEWHPNGRTRVGLSPSEGKVLVVHDALAEPVASRAYNALYPLHSARVGGRPYDALAALTGIALALLACIGAGTFAWQRWRRVARTRSASAAQAAAESVG